MNSNILVVEDEVDLADSITEILRLHGMQPHWVADGRSALEIIALQRFDLILCDINLPDTDGYAILDAVRNNARTYSTPFIFLTAFSSEEEVRTGMNKGADDYIGKPFSIQVLINAIKARLSKSRQDRNFRYHELSSQWLDLLTENFNHEFLTPLNGILSAGYILDNALTVGQQESLRGFIDVIYTGSYRMLRNTRKLLTFGLLQANKLIIDPHQSGALDVPELIQGLVGDIKKQHVLPVTDIEFRFESVQPVWADRQCFTMIIAELLENMLIFHEGAGKPVIIVSRDNKQHVISFTNELSQSAHFSLDQVGAFRKFHLDASRKGLGVGLFNVKALCDLQHMQLSLFHTDNAIRFQLMF